jgi:NAD(P)-dependent dehydrogenase (short-subunit alcohol dehydrogenase family)
MEQLKAVLRETWNTERVDFLINNAGIGKTIPIANLTENDFDTLLNIYFKGVVFLNWNWMNLHADSLIWVSRAFGAWMPRLTTTF